MKPTTFSTHHRVTAFAFAFACAATACQGDDTALGVGPGGADGGGQGGTGTSGTGGSGARGGSAGTGGMAVTDAATAATDSTTEGGPAVTNGPCPLLDGGGGRFQLYSFDFGDGGDADLAAWSTFMMGPIAASTDDSAGESTPKAGSLHAAMTYGGYGTFPVLESYHAVPLDFSCFTTMHISIKITSPVTYIPFVTLYVTSGALAPGVGYFSGNLLATNDIADGNWHDLAATLSGNKAAIQRIGFQIYPPAAQPDGGPMVPPPVDVFIDDVWLE